MRIQKIETEHAPKAIGPYSQGIISGNFLFISGQIPIDPYTGKLIEADIKKKTERVIENILSIVKSAGGNIENIVKVTVYVKNMRDFDSINEVYSSYFNEHRPARSFVEVSNLPKNAEIEMEAVAYIESK